MTAYATPSDLAAYLQKDLDTSTAQLVLDKTSVLFSLRADTQFLPTTAMFQAVGQGFTELRLPFWPIISVSALRINGTTYTDYTRIKRTLYRLLGFGIPGRYPPDLVEVDLTHGFQTPPEDVIGAVLESAAMAYMSPDNTTLAEAIDDYSIKMSADNGGIMLSHSATLLANLYRGTFSA